MWNGGTPGGRCRRFLLRALLCVRGASCVGTDEGTSAEVLISATQRNPTATARVYEIMPRIRRTVSSVVAAATLAAGLAAAPASAASDIAAPQLLSATTDSDDVTLRAVGVDRMRVRVHVTDRSGVANVAMFAMPERMPDDFLANVDPDGDGEPDEAALGALAEVFSIRELRLVSGTARDGVWSGTVLLSRRTAVGPYSVSLMAMDKVGNMAMSTAAAHFTARWRTAVRGLDVSPEGAAPGSAVTVAGRLMHVTSAGWEGFGNRGLKVQFRPAGSSTWTTKGAVRSRADGTFSNSTKFHANRTGAWRVTFAGGKLNAPSTSGADAVAVG